MRGQKVSPALLSRALSPLRNPTSLKLRNKSGYYSTSNIFFHSWFSLIGFRDFAMFEVCLLRISHLTWGYPICFTSPVLPHYVVWLSQRRAGDRYRLRMHRARSAVLTSDEMVEVRAAQRTFEGAYVRTALSQFSFALVVLKIFTAEFYSIGALFAIYGTGVLIIGLFRRSQGNRQFFSEVGEDGIHRHKFRTSGNAVLVLTALSIAAYACLIGLTLNLSNW